MTAPQFQPGEPLSAAKLNRLSAAVDASGIQPGPGVHGESGPSGSSVRATPYRRIGIGRTGGANYPLHPYGSDTIDTSFPFEFVDIDPDLTPVIKERGDAAFTLRNINGHYLPADTMVEVMEHRGDWYTSYVPALDYGTIRVRNDYPFTLPRFAPVGIDDPVDNPGLSQANQHQLAYERIFSCTKPVVPRHRTRFAVLQQQLKPCEVGLAVVSGLTAVRDWEPQSYVAPHTPSSRFVQIWRNNREDWYPLLDLRYTPHVVQPLGPSIDPTSTEINTNAQIFCLNEWWGQTAANQIYTPTDNGPDCGGGVCEYVCTNGHWQVDEANSTVADGCTCEHGPEPNRLFVMPCTETATISTTFTRNEMEWGVARSVAQVRLSNDARFVDPADFYCENSTCTFTCTETATDVWEWVSRSKCFIGCQCPAEPDNMGCDATSCPRQITRGCTDIPPPTSTTSPPTTSTTSPPPPPPNYCQWVCWQGYWRPLYGSDNCGAGSGYASQCCSETRGYGRGAAIFEPCTTELEYLDSECVDKSCADTCTFLGLWDAEYSIATYGSPPNWITRTGCCGDGCPCGGQLAAWPSYWWEGVEVDSPCGDACVACPGVCTWQWTAAGGWSNISDTCVGGGCSCVAPPSETMTNNPAEGRLHNVPCCSSIPTTTTTTSTSTPPTTTTTTTTTTEAPCTGVCELFCNNGEWEVTSSTCASVGSCGCCSYTAPCSHGETKQIICVFDWQTTPCPTTTTTTTTTSGGPPPTTTTTTTSTSSMP